MYDNIQDSEAQQSTDRIGLEIGKKATMKIRRKP